MKTMHDVRRQFFRARLAIRTALPEKYRAPARLVWGFLKEPALAILLALAATTAVARPYYVPSGSMEPTLQIGDELLATKFAYGYSRYSLPFEVGPPSPTRFLGRMPARGDIVVFRLPRDTHQVYVKRVIGLPGDRIAMRAGRLWINGRMLTLKPDGSGQVEAENGATLPAQRFIETLPGGRTHPIFKLQWRGPLDDTAEFVVPKDHLFMMGDNRDNSLDSRVAAEDGGVGYVPMENLIGRAEVILGSVDYPNARSLLGWPAQMRAARTLKRVR